MAPIRKGDGTPLEIPGVSEVRSGDGRVFFEDAIPDSAVNRFALDEGSGTTAEDSIGSLNLTLDQPSWVSNNWQGSFALDFDPSNNDYADAGQQVSTIDENENFSIAATIDLDSASGDPGDRGMIAEQLDADSNGFSFGVADTDGEIAVRDWADNNVSGSIDIQTKTRVVSTYNSSDGLNLYINTNAQTGSEQVVNGTAESNFIVGARSDLNGSFLDGRLDDIIIYDTELDTNEIDQDYNAQPWV